MWQRVAAIIRKEFIHILRDKRTLRMILFVPLMQLSLFALAIHSVVDHVPTVVADQSMDAASRAYVQALEASGSFEVLAYVASEAEAVRMVDAGQAQVAVVLPPDMQASVNRGEAQALILIDGSEVFTAQSVYGVASVIAQEHAMTVMLERRQRSGRAGAEETLLPLEARLRILYNPTRSDLWFIVPSMMAMILQVQAVLLTSAAVVRERESGTIEQLLVTPIRPLELMLGKLLPSLVVVMINMLSILALSVYGFGVPFRGSFALFFELSVPYTFAGLGLGLLISTVSRNHVQSQQLAMLMMFLGLVLGGFLFPRYAMPKGLYYLGFGIPLTHFVPIARAIVLRGVGWGPLREHVWAMLIYIVAVMTLATRAFRQSLD